MGHTKFILRPRIEVARDPICSSLRLKTPPRRGLSSQARALALGAGLVMAILMFATDGGNERFYSTLHRTGERTSRLVTANLARALPGFRQKDPSTRFALQGIVYSATHPIAVINRKICQPGETLAISVGRQSELIQCLDIQPDSVQIQTEAGAKARLGLKPPSPPKADEAGGAGSR